MITEVFRAIFNFWRDYWRLMRNPTPLELDQEYSARTGWMAPNQLEHELDELERTQRWKQLGFIRGCILYPIEQLAEHRKAHRIASTWRDRYRQP